MSGHGSFRGEQLLIRLGLAWWSSVVSPAGWCTRSHMAAVGHLPRCL